MKKNIIAKLRIRDCIKIMFYFCFMTIFCRSAWIALPIFIKELDIFHLELTMAYVYSVWNLSKNIVVTFMEAAIRGINDEDSTRR